MNKFLCVLTAVSLSLFFSGCQKNSDSPSGSGAKAILTSGKWQLQSSVAIITFPGIDPITQDAFSVLPACQTDNYSTFNNDGTTTTDEGATKCSAGDPQTKSGGTWQLLNNDKQLKIADPAQTSIIVTADILELDDSHIKVKYTTSGSPGATAVTTTVLKHIK